MRLLSIHTNKQFSLRKKQAGPGSEEVRSNMPLTSLLASFSDLGVPKQFQLYKASGLQV
jgi:hypothetical protein